MGVSNQPLGGRGLPMTGHKGRHSLKTSKQQNYKTLLPPPQPTKKLFFFFWFFETGFLCIVLAVLELTL